ncbi:MAG: hypothetical protein EBZ84_09465 [Betaproteobacteria bacterium]|nr:hypothetical protein [Betaproteobacteria bacterium]
MGLAVNLALVTGGTAGFTVTNTGGATTLTGSAKDDTIAGGTGNDSLSGGAGADRFLFASTAALNGTDTLADFVAGGGDILDFSAFDIDRNGTFDTPVSLSNFFTSNPSSSTPVSGTIVRLVDISSGQDIKTADGLQTALATGGEYVNIVMAIDSKAIFITSATNGSDADYIFFATSDGNGVITVALVGQTAANSDIDLYVNTGFGI